MYPVTCAGQETQTHGTTVSSQTNGALGRLQTLYAMTSSIPHQSSGSGGAGTYQGLIPERSNTQVSHSNLAQLQFQPMVPPPFAAPRTNMLRATSAQQTPRSHSMAPSLGGGNEMRILNNQASGIIEAKRLRAAGDIAATGFRLGSQQSDDSTMRYSSQTSDLSQQQSVLFLRDTERAVRVEGKLDELIRTQIETNTRLKEVAALISKHYDPSSKSNQSTIPVLMKRASPCESSESSSVVRSRQSNKGSSSQGPVASSKDLGHSAISGVSAPPRQSSVKNEPDSDDDMLFADDWPESAEELFRMARQAREHKKIARARSVFQLNHHIEDELASNMSDDVLLSGRVPRPPLRQASLHSNFNPTRYVWDGRKVSPLDGSNAAQELKAMVAMLATNMSRRLSDFKGLMLTLHKSPRRRDPLRRYTIPSKKGLREQTFANCNPRAQRLFEQYFAK